ncbi:sensor histidine kinase [Streptomyces sp. RY43-2]|uniref:histidine kinase n=1 Tax=Streptomyces macrolidinus TaxID=2952607 RepID=A0ABT0ZE40_9ACTN|nr:sensor histidine kinase [Streptomyces macrolidinus]MCN9241835.1 sensor histidine kinase [Streptomyces macrolidinus]
MGEALARREPVSRPEQVPRSEKPRRLRRLARVMRDDLGTFAAAPLPPLSRPRGLGLAPHVLVGLIALLLTVSAPKELTSGYGLPGGLATAIALVQGGAVVFALWRPLPAWWLSLAAMVVANQFARLTTPSVRPPESTTVPALVVPRPLPGAAHLPPWPWTAQSVLACAVVLLLLALRARTRVCAEVLAVTAAVTLLSVPAPVRTMQTAPAALVVFLLVVLVGGVLRGRREARTQLVELSTVTAEERARRTLLEERNRIARELHDVVAHHMSVISIQAQVAPHLVKDPPDELRENLDGIRANALEALTELRRVLGVLRAENPEDPYGIGSGTGTAPDSPQPTLDRLDALVENTRAAGLEVEAETTGEVRPLPSGVELSAYRIVQEALSNALRHAPGSTVRVELGYVPRGVRVQVVNSRPTHSASPSPGAGHGLLGMRERAAMLGGTLVASETASGGFAVDCFLPGPAGPPPGDDPEDEQDYEPNYEPDGPTGEMNR